MLRIAISFYFIALLFYSASALAQNNDGDTFQALYDSAKKHGSAEKGELALAFALEKQNDAWIAKSYFLIAYYEEEMALYYKSLKNLFLALKHYKYDEDARGQIKSLVSIALIYTKAGFYEKSLSFYEEAFGLIRPDLEIKTRANLEYNYARVLRKLGDHDTAKKFYSNALTRFEQIDDQSHISRIYLELGLSNVSTEHYEQAKKYYSKAANIFPKGSPQWENIMLKKLNSFGYISIMQNKTDSALHTFQSALSLSTENSQNNEVLSQIYDNLGSIYRDRGAVDSAVIMYTKSVEYGDFYAFDHEFIKTCKYLYQYHTDHQQEAKAGEYFETISNFAIELAGLQDELNQGHIQYQVEAANFRREAELQYQAKQTERLRSLAAGGLALLLVALLFYVIRKEQLRTRRVRVFINSMKWQ